MLNDSINIEYNSRLTPSIVPEIVKTTPKSYTIERIAKAILPLIVMIKPIGKALELLGGVYSTYDAVTGTEKNLTIKFLKITFHATSIGLLWFNPLAVSLIQNSWEAIINTRDFGKCILNSDLKQSSIYALKMTEKYIFIASIIVGGPSIILISMISQTAIDAYRLSKFQDKGMLLEASVQAVVIGTRCHGIYKHIDSNKKHFQNLCAKINQKANSLIHRSSNATKTSNNSSINTPEQQSMLVAVLYKYGNNPNIPPLYKAIEAGDINAAKILLDFGVDVNQRGSPITITVCPQRQQFTFVNEAKTVLELAIEKNMIELIPILLSKDADPYLFRQIQYLEYNNKYSAHVQWKTTALYDAIKSNKLEVLEIFKQFNVDFNEICFYDLESNNSKSFKPIQLALSNESYKKILTFLIESGARF